VLHRAYHLKNYEFTGIKRHDRQKSDRIEKIMFNTISLRQNRKISKKENKIDHSWSFSNKTRKDTAYITHGYHRYPAKFIPQIVSRLTEKYTKEGDLIVDPFGGCGTTLVESKVMGRPSIAVDINPVAVLITKAKIAQYGYRKVISLQETLRRNHQNQLKHF